MQTNPHRIRAHVRLLNIIRIQFMMSVVSHEVLVEMVLSVESLLALIPRTVGASISLMSGIFGPQVTSQNIRPGELAATGACKRPMVATNTVKIEGGL